MNIAQRLFAIRLFGLPFWMCLMVNLMAIAVVSWLGPIEKSLGSHVRVVYLHGAWVWTALAGFSSAAAAGLAALLLRQQRFYTWSLALGRTGLLFWITYLPLSLWAMQSNWNGLFLAEPRWRLALAFAVAGLLIQVALTVMDQPVFTALCNILFAVLIFVLLSGVQNVMHPRSPIWDSDSSGIQLFFVSLLLLTLLLAVQVAYASVMYNRYGGTVQPKFSESKVI